MKHNVPANYTAWNPNSMGREHRRAYQQLRRMDREQPIIMRDFRMLSMVLQCGFQRVSYEAWYLDPGLYFWLTDAHAAAIGRALTPELQYFGLIMTCLEADGFTILAEHVRPDVQIDELLVKHTSGDEVTAVEANGLALLVATLGVRTFHLWAGEFDSGALETFARQLLTLQNTTLVALDICDTSRPEPDDRQTLSDLDTLLQENRYR